MKIKLISPKMSLRPMDSEFKRLMSPSLALLTIAALTPDQHDVYVEDENAGELNLHDAPGLVGITVNVDTSARAYEIAALYLNKGIPVVLGGIHVSANPHEGTNLGATVCIGDADKLWEEIVRDAESGRLARIYSNDGDVSLDSTPPPDMSKIVPEKYLYTNVIYSGRNCPFKCEFCYNSCDYALSHRKRPVRNVIEEIEGMGTKHVMFVDDNFIGDIRWAGEFVQKIKGRGIRWNCAVSANILKHLKLLDEMKESGLKSLFIGFETINQDSLNKVGKYQNNIENYDRLVKEIHDREIMINASLAFGFDEDTPRVFDDTLDWLVENRIETMTGHILTPYPGTKLFERFEKEGRITDYNWSNYNTSKVVFEPKMMTRDELLNGYLKIYDKFYSLANIYRRLPVSRNQWRAFLAFNLIYRKYGKFASKLSKFGLMRKIGSLARKICYGID